MSKSQSTGVGNSRRIGSLQGMRFFFQIPIFMVHLSFVQDMQGKNQWYNERIYNAALSVTFFFILSGFVFVIGSGEKCRELSLSGYGHFIKKRYIKMAPLYIITMFIAFVWWFIGAEGIVEKGKILLKFIFSLTMLQTATIKYWNLFNAVCWFASCLFICYLAAPMLLRFLEGKKKRAGLCVGGSFLIICLFIILVRYLVFGGSISEDAGNLFLYVSPYVRIFYFLIGMGLGLLCRQRKEKSKSWYTFMEAASVLLLVGAYFFRTFNGDTEENNLLYIPVCCLLLYVFSFDGGKISSFLGKEINQYLGKVSLYFFMIHYIVINYGGKQLLTGLFQNHYSGLICVILFAVSLLSAIAFERLLYLITCHRHKQRNNV